MMKSLFQGFYRPDDDAFKCLWRDAKFVLDTGVLINLYRYPGKARDELMDVFTSIADRLWVPYQAALEYQRNRLSVIAEQKQRFHEVREVVNNVVPTLEKELAKFQLEKRHALIDPSKLIASLKKNTDDYVKELDTLEKGQIDVYDEDNIRIKIDFLLKDRIGQKPSQAIIDQITQDGEKRYKANMPPGFKDVKKPEKPHYSYNGIAYQGKFGDLILWSEIKDFVGANKGCSIILVTDDDKEDWWWKVNSSGEKTIGPRPELIAELCEEMGAKGFWMYNSTRFLKYAKDYLGVKVSDDSIGQIKEINSARDFYTDIGMSPGELVIDARYKVERALRKTAERLRISDAKRMPVHGIKILLRERGVIDEYTSKSLDEVFRTYFEPSDALEDIFAEQYAVLATEIIRKLDTIN